MSKKKVWTTEEILENLKERWLDMKLTTKEYKELVAEVKEQAKGQKGQRYGKRKRTDS